MLYPETGSRERDAGCDGVRQGVAAQTAGTRLRIAETFTSRQGEGLLTGVPSFFIRTSGCNLRCWFCDTPYASWKPEGPRMTIADLVEQARRATFADPESSPPELPSPVQHVVLTGGEPLVAAGIAELATALRASGLHLTIETAGTVDIEIPCDLLSLSPKLSASTPAASEHPEWAARHEQRRMPLQTMRNLIARAASVQVKFVVDSAAEFAEIFTIIEQLDIAAQDVWIMPQGVTVEQLDAAAQWLGPWAQEHGFRYCDRMHIRWYGNRRGT